MSMWLIRATITEHTEPELSCSGYFYLHYNMLSNVDERKFRAEATTQNYPELPHISLHVGSYRNVNKKS